MADFRGRVLEILDRIYHFTGTVASTSRLDLNAPIQLVHDVSREAELGSAYGRHEGFAIVGAQVTHVGASTAYTAVDPYATVIAWGGFDPGAQPTREDIGLWLMDVSVAVLNGALTSLATSLDYPEMLPQTGTDNVFPLNYETFDTIPFCNYAGVGDRIVMLPSLAGTVGTNYPNFPRYLPYGTRIAFRTVTSGAEVIETRSLVWMGQKGTSPPGAR
jgi:hypothetical protein